MSANDDDIRVRIAGDLADINRAIKELRRETKQAGQDARDSSKGWQTLSSNIDGIRRNALRLLAPLAAAFSIRGIARFTQASIDNAAALADNARAAGQTAETVQELQFAFGQLGELTREDTDRALIRFNKTLGEANEQAGSGRQAFRALGVDLKDATGNLRSSEDVLDDVLRGLAAIEDPGIRAARAADLFGREAGPQLAGALGQGIGALDEARQLAHDLGLVLSEDLVQGADDAQDKLNQLKRSVSIEFQQLVLENVDTIITLAEAFTTLSRAVFDTVEGLVNFGGVGLDAPTSALQREIRQLEDLRGKNVLGRTGLMTIGGEFEFNISDAEIDAELARLQAEIDRRAASVRVRGRGGKAREQAENVLPTTEDLQALQRALATASDLIRDEVQRTRELLDRNLEQNLISFRAYYEERARLETQAIDAQLAERQASLDTVREEIELLTDRGAETTSQLEQVRKIESEVAILQRERAEIAGVAAAEQAEAEQKLAESLDDVRLRLLRLQGDDVAATALELEREFEDLFARLAAEGDEAGRQLVQNLIDTELAAAQLTEIEDQFQAALERMALAEQHLQTQVQTGLVSEREGREELLELNAQTAEQLEALIPTMQQLAAATGDPDAILRVEQLVGEIESLNEVTKEFAGEAGEAVKSAGADAFSSWLDGTADAASAWDSFLSGVRGRIADLISDKLFDQLFSMLDPTGAGGGGGGGFFANLFHDGGRVGRGGRGRRISPLAFAGAPRMHSGGIAGLASDEVPAILQSGEGVVSRRDMQRGMGRKIEVNIQAQDVRSFQHASRGQIGATVASEINRAANRNG